MRVGGRSPKKNPIDGRTPSGLPLGCMCSCTTRSVPGSSRQARSASTSGGDLPGGPAEEVAIRVLGRAGQQSVVAGRAIGVVEPPRAVAAVDADVGVVDHPGVAGAELDAADVAGAGHRQRHREDAEDVARLAGQGVAVGQRHHQVGLAEMPAVGPARRRRRRTRALDRRLRPAGDARDLVGGEPRLGDELAGVAVGLPRRHEAAGGDRGQLRRAPAGVVEGEEVERPGPARPVALGAVRMEQRRDVLVEGRRRDVGDGR